MRLRELRKLVEQLGGGETAVAAKQRFGDYPGSSIGSGFTPASDELFPSLYKDRDRVYLAGRLTHAAGAVDADIIAHLPEECWPPAQHYVETIIRDTTTDDNFEEGGVVILPTGEIMLQGVGGTGSPNGLLIVLDGIDFRISPLPV